MAGESSAGEPRELSRSHYAALAAFRYELRRFLAFSEAAATGAGLPPQQHQALLTVAGHLGPEPPTVGHIAERLMIAVGLLFWLGAIIARMVFGIGGSVL